MSEFNFNSQICTTKVQSERLFALGIKIETADCYHWQETDRYGDGNGKWHCEILPEYNKNHYEYLYNAYGVDGSDEGFFIPAWSLHRLLCMIPNIVRAEKPFENSFSSLMNIVISTLGIAYYYEDYDENRIYEFECFENLMEASVSAIEWLIKEGYFPKEYLV